ncbi:SDR family NAD(P)-dependent oxidoreductase [Streptomyces sp. SL13]|uniref:SDR family NAD(P)-dependent oxidoreductase n=1 Tax=Streptantibioticus silvisoli TaxID=2705255 RepID=A0AA90K7V0_9ACTN|nr:type I polyketide synthase [Streptantibioticus silvisoli]MDI5968727.1 SDR family NAD(P)-dependent oxidoreductase [Streptantibioticus silvisoli]
MDNEDKLRDYLKRVTTDLRQTRRRLAEVEARRHEPIAIVAMSCRMPGGVRNPEELWRLVADGTDAISAMPTNRGWDLEGLYDPDPDRRGTSYARDGGFLYDAPEFDAGFFEISPREAVAMDPQQRLLLETTWEVFERAGIDPHTLRGSRSGVFIGSSNQGYASDGSTAPEGVEGHLLTGGSAAVLSGRLAYSFGLEGPAVSIDTMCSSSLVALHLAVRALRNDECTMALAGGATVMANTRNFVEFSRQRGLSVDGRCKPFSADADGTGWGEGVGVLLLERLSDAQRNGHPVVAVIRGSAINQDGASNGLTAPNGPSQQRVIMAALEDAGLSTSEVDAVEAHGTGTALGDPIEAQALLATYGQDRPEGRPLWLGSLKSNIGHAQAASGVAAIIKMVESLRHGVLPKTLHAEDPSPHVDWSAGEVKLLTEAVEWPETGQPRRVGVSSFGGSGTNAHVLLEQAPVGEADEEQAAQEPPTAARAAAVLPWTLSARSEAALKEQAARLADHIETSGLSPVDLAHSLATGRAGLEERALLVGTDPAALVADLRAVAGGATPNGARGTDETAGEETDIVFVFPGQGSQWVGMAVGLLDSSPVFAARFAECEAALEEFVDWSLSDVVRGAEDAPGFDRVDVVQPALWAVMVSLAALWESFGVVPSAVVGHSQGEIAAACVAGGLSLRDGARVVALRSRAITVMAGHGGMVSVALPHADAEELAGRWDGVSVAAVNGPTSVVVSGDADALTELVAHCEASGVRARRIEVDYASHSAHVESLKDELFDVLSDVVPLVPRVPFFSTVTGDWVEDAAFDAEYWFTNLRRTVRLESSVRELAAQGHRVFVEMSPHPVLTLPVEETLADAGVDAVVTGTLRRGEGGLARFYASLGEVWVSGVAVEWDKAFTGLAPSRVELPTYAFQRQRFWLEPARPAEAAGAASGSVDEAFWDTVEREDLAELAGALGLADPESLSEVLPALSSYRKGTRERGTVDGWRYRVVWRHQSPPPGGALTGTWLVVVPEGHQDDDHTLAVLGAVRGAGARTATFALDGTRFDRAEVTARLREALAGEGDDAVQGVISLLALDERLDDLHSGATVALVQALALVQGLLDAEAGVPLWLLTTGAADTGTAGDAVRNPIQAAMWGFGRVLALEHPKLWGGLVDLPEVCDEHTANGLTSLLAEGGDEDQTALRAGGLFIRRLVRAPLNGKSSERSWRTSGAALVTGGTGGLGGHTARLLARNGAEHLVLTSRHGMEAPGAAELRDELTALGVRVTIAACDVADRDQLAALVRQVEADGPAIRTVVHTAGVGMLAPLAETSTDYFAEGARAKLLGAFNLDQLFDHDRLDAFVIYSSVAGTWGSGDHGAYSSSNAYADALAENRRARGLTGVSIAWGIWSPEGGGMAVNVLRETLRWRGIPFMDPQLAVAGFQQVLDHDETFLAVADIDWERFVPVFTAAHSRPLLHEVPEVAAALEADKAVGEAVAGTSDTLRARLTALEPAERDRELSELVRGEVAGVLGHEDNADVAVGRAFRELGFDSLTAVELRNRLNAATGLKLPPTVVFDYPNVRELAGHLRTRLIGDDAPAPAAVVASTVPADDDPIAIVSMGCRFPGGVRSPEDLWRLVRDEVDAVSQFPSDRGWDLEALYDPDPDKHGTSYTREGGFLDAAPEFDAAFFGISPREAVAMDPQQRLLLETSWEAVERAGIDPHSLRGSRTGVFVGAAHQGYGNGFEVPGELEGHLITGTVTSIASGRISYTLGLEGPAVTLDTGCSSSLVAMHLASRALQSGECSLAIVGAAAVMGEPIGLVGFSRQRGLATDGRCKAFAAAADGMGMAEGVGVLVLERLSQARRNGHQVLAVVRGSAINQDGASNGLTAPNGLSQQRVIREALANAGWSASEVDVVEAHGTGTKLGDPIEAQALLATYGQDRPADRPLWLGSVKSNIGHSQAASGMAGVIKMIESMRHGVLPRTLHVDEASPHVDWSTGAVELLSQSRAWEQTDRPRRAGVSSFGVSGTNAHVLLEQPEPEPVVAPVERPSGVVAPWPVSARSADALREQVERLTAAVSEDGLDPVDVGWSLLTSRAVFEHRAVLVDGAVVASGAELPGGRGPVFVFPGQGSQWVGMAAGLLDSSPVFAARFAECEAALDAYVDWSLSDVVRGVEGAPGFDRVDVVQPALWAVMVSLAALWESFGVAPSAVVGHSQGEIAAAVVAGALSVADGARVAALRSRAIAAMAGHGGMVSVALSHAGAQELSERWEGVSVAAVNGPTSVVVSGDADALTELVAHCEATGVRARRVEVDYASHSAHMESLKDELLEVLAPVAPVKPRVPFFSTVTGEWISDAVQDAEYWFSNLRHTVRLESSLRELAAQGHRVFVEVSAHPVLTMPVEETLADAGVDAVVTGTLRRGEGGLARFYASLGRIWAAGAEVAWDKAFTGLAPRQVALPTYAFQRQRYWLEPAPAVEAAGGASGAVDEAFWETVEREDLVELAGALGLDDHGSLSEVLPALSSYRKTAQQRGTVDRWRYRVAWRHQPEAARTELRGTWLVVLPGEYQDDHHVQATLRAVEAAGARVRLLALGAEDADREWLADRLRVETRLSAVDGPAEPFAGVLSFTAFEERRWSVDRAMPAGLVLLSTLLQALGDAGIDAPLWCATRGAVSVGRSDTLDRPEQAMTWGLGRIAALEYPQRWGGLIDLPDVVDERAARRLPAVLSGDLSEDHIALRSSGLFARRLARAGAPTRPAGPEWRPSGTVLVTGGTGGVARHVARWLARGGAEHLVLVSRRGPQAPGADELVAELAELGTPATVVACDVSDAGAVRDLVDNLPSPHPLTAVVHAAGVIDDGVIDALTPERADGVLRPKVDAALALHEATRHLDLSAFVLFSSMAGTLGGPGQGSYAAANAFLDAMAQQRRTAGLPATSIGWGTWAGGGMVSEEVAARLRRDGVPPMAPELALSALQKALDEDETFMIVADVDWKVAVPRAVAALREFPEIRSQDGAEGHKEEDGPQLVRRLRGLAPAERRTALLLAVRTQAAAVLGHDGPDAVAEDRAFRDLGFDSLTAVELRNRLAEASGLRLPVTMAFDHPSASVLAAFLHDELFGATDAAPSDGDLPTASVDDDPIVIVGMGCRFPGGVRSPEELWRLVADGTDAISAFPDNRGWDVESLYDPDPDKAGHSYARHGGFLYDADHFDAAFFGISPREAVAIDPQHRLLLETTWEAFERAGIDPASVRGSRAGVFVGSNYNDYRSRARRAPEGLEGYLATGSASSVASGRIAYTFGLEGPAVTVDTACSSSLVALHLAAQALRSGECSLALAGGVTVISLPDTFIEFSRQRALSPDGRCKPFSAQADGAGWAEGVGLLLLERMSDARRNGHTVLAKVAGSAVNQDGASNGLTAPNGPSQQRVIRQALASAGLSPSDVDAVEAHGTGTSLGDPIEAQALMAVYGQQRPVERPLWLGALKSNIGHTQAASGVAGVIKMVMAMRNGVLPRTLHCETPSPHIDWSSGAVRLLAEQRDWVAGDGPRRAGVSAFGISGTNAHLILEEPQAVEAPAPRTDAPAVLPAAVPWLLSARGTAALREQAALLLRHLDAAPGTRAEDVALALATDRAALEDRAAIVGSGPEDLVEALTALAEGREHPRLTRDRARTGATAFLFPGQGAQRAQAGRRLYALYDAFADALDAVCGHLDAYLERPLRDVLFAEDGTPEAELLHRTQYTQAGLFALEVALFRFTEHLGMTPDVLLGHSVGELAAAHVAGVLSLPDACRLVAARGRLMQALPEGGAMIAVQASEEELLPLLAPYEGRAAIAALNGPTATVLSGDVDAVTAVADKLAADGRKTKRLRVSHAFHSPHMDAMLDEFAAIAAELDYRAPALPIVSNLTGRTATAEELSDPAYWVRHAREAVRFRDGVARLDELGVTSYVELGPDGVLTAMAGDCLETPGAVLVPLLRAGTEETEALTTALARLHTRGVALDRGALLAPLDARATELPTYAFQRQRYWLEATQEPQDMLSAGLDAAGHPLLTAAVQLAGSDGIVLTGMLSIDRHPWLADHRLDDTVLFPGTAFLELALEACERVGAAQVAELTLEAPLVLPADSSVRLQLAVGGADATGTRTLTVHSRPAAAAADLPWTRHASGSLSDTPAAAGTDRSDGAAWPPPEAEPVEIGDLYERIADNHFFYGPAFRGLRAAWRHGEEILADIALDAEHHALAADFTLHPALLDAALHTVALATAGTGRAVLPFSFTGVSVTGAGPAALRVRLTPAGGDSFTLRVADSTGTPVATVDSLVLRPVDTARIAAGNSANSLHRLVWTPVGPGDPTGAAPAVLSAGAGDALTRLVTAGAAAHDDLAALGAAVDAGAPVPATVLVQVPATADGDDLAAATRQATRHALETAQAWLRDERFTDARLVFCTRHAVATGPGDAAGTDPAQAAVWGLIRTAKTENPGRFALLDHDGSTASLDALPAVLAGGEPETALREGVATAPRLARAARTDAETSGAFGAGTVLVTGGGGVLGQQVARHLVTEHGVRSLFLAGRRGADGAGMRELCDELRGHGADVRPVACDISDREAVAALLASVPAEHPLTAVVHTAGVLDDGVLDALTPDRVDTVLGAKADGALHLDELTRGLGLSAFVLFSSLAGTFGGVAQGNYAAANAFLDALAARRRAAGDGAVSLAWGLWAERSGMTGKLDEADLRRMARGGVVPMDTAEALALLDAAVAADEHFLVPAKLDIAALRSPDGSVPHLLRGLAGGRTPRVAASGAALPNPVAAEQTEQTLTERLSELAEQHRLPAVLEAVTAQAALVLGHTSADAIDPERGFLELGFDSLTAVELRNRLGVVSGVRLPATLLFDYPTAIALSDHLLVKMAPAAPAERDRRLLMAQFDQWDTEFAGIVDADLQRDLRGRLTQLLSRLDGVTPTAAFGDTDTEEVPDDELLDFIENELGGA